MNRRAGFLKRLPLLAAIALGAVLWKAGVFPQERSLIWRLPLVPGLSHAELQVYEGTEIIKRDERFFTGAIPETITETISLRAGQYAIRTFYVAGEQRLSNSETLTVGSESTYSVR